MMKNFSQNSNNVDMNHSYSNNSMPNYSNNNANTKLDDKVIMDNILSVIKGNCDLFMHGTIESSTPNVHQAFKSSLDETLQIQNEVYNQMSQRGWYTTQPVEQQKIAQTKQKFSQTQQS